METPLDSLRDPLEQAIKGALNRNALNNRGTLASFKLPGIALSIVKILLDMDGGLPKAQQLGSELGQQGLSTESVFAAQAAVVEIAAKLELVTDRIVLTRHVLDIFAALFTALLKADQAEIERQRVQMEQAFFSTVASQRQAEDALRSAIRELSTPIMPVAESILVLPLVGSIDSHRASEINERLLEGIAEHQAEIVIIDITGVPLMDTSTANLLLMTTKAANLLGSQIILCGIGAEIAQTITHLGVDLTNLTTMANLQSSISYALELTGLAIKPL